MKDVTGFPLEKGDLVALMAKIVDIDPECVTIRILNSEMELRVSCDEVMGVASSELQKIQMPEPDAPPEAKSA
jgi:hypothetical protein